MNNAFYTADDVAAMLNCTRQTAYSVMRDLNRELTASGRKVMPGRVSAGYFNARYGLDAATVSTAGDSVDQEG